LDVGTCATLACLWEATAAKPGNVHRSADFDDVTYADFITSAAVIGPHLARSSEVGVGPAVLAATQATQQAVRSNTNLGTILLLAPLAAVPRDTPLADGIAQVLARLDLHDTACVYQAVRVARPGGLGRVAEGDVAAAPPQISLVDAMQLAADRDLVARQYANNFREVLFAAAPLISAGLELCESLEEALVYAHLHLLAEYSDSLVARKCGPATAQQLADRAASVIAAGKPGEENYGWALSELDFWLRSDHHRRNPGTTADLLAAGLFVLLRDNQLPWPIPFYRCR
jgi:triphosphoribosyl-dephospho-CoA synthase